MSDLGTQLTITPVDGGIDLEGEIDAHTAPQLETALTELLADRPDVNIGMSGVTFMDSSGLRVIIAATETGRGRGGDIVLVDPTTTVSRLLQVSGLTDHLTVRTDS